MNNLPQSILRKVVNGFIFCVIVPALIIAVIWLSLKMPNTARSAEWQEITIENFHAIRVPRHWILTEKDGFFYFADREIEQTNSFKGITIFMIGNGSFLQSLEKTYENVTHVERLRGFALDGSGAHYGVDVYSIDNEHVEKFWVGFERGTDESWRTLGFINIDDSVT